MASHLPLIVVEVLMVFGGALAFGWWQLRSLHRDREAARRRAQAAEDRAGDDAA